VEETRPYIPLIGDPAPDFEAPSTHGPIRLSDFRGQWVVLFSHPADFTPVCTTEFVAFTERAQEFEKRNVQLIGLSVDSVSSHLAWQASIERAFGVTIPFPIIADLSQQVARTYGMIPPTAESTVTVRTVFFIDDKGIVRALIYYPLSLGRSMDEILRVVDALQFNQREGLSTPANWMPGNPAVVPAPTTVEGLRERERDADDPNQKTWYLKLRG
jgi:peroxiredoxin (alkyl hydroperoxide reductase subunit C)